MSFLQSLCVLAILLSQFGHSQLNTLPERYADVYLGGDFTTSPLPVAGSANPPSTPEPFVDYTNTPPKSGSVTPAPQQTATPAAPQQTATPEPQQTATPAPQQTATPGAPQQTATPAPQQTATPNSEAVTTPPCHDKDTTKDHQGWDFDDLVNYFLKPRGSYFYYREIKPFRRRH